MAELRDGMTVLDLGSGGGIDVLLSARRVAPTGTAYGLDMTDEMLDLARTNQAKAGITNVHWLKGHIEAIPLPAETVDVVLSNCVINLSTDKPQVLREAARVLKPGGWFAVSDVIADPDMDDATRTSMQQYVGCVAGALTRDHYERYLADAGLTEIEITETHRVHEHAGSAIIRARKPADRVAARSRASIRLRIELLVLDLTTCRRCLGANASLEAALDAAGVDVTAEKILVSSAEQSRAVALRDLSHDPRPWPRRRARAAREFVRLGSLHRRLRRSHLRDHANTGVGDRGTPASVRCALSGARGPWRHACAAICGPTTVTSGIGCSAHCGAWTPAASAAMRAQWRSKPAGVQTST